MGFVANGVARTVRDAALEGLSSGTQHLNDALGKGAPPPPDYMGLATQMGADSQNAMNAQTMANRPNQTNAFGSSIQWSQNPDGSWTQKQSLGGPLGQANQSLMGQAAANLSNPFSFRDFSSNGQSARDQAFNAYMGQAESRLNPMWNRREEAMQTRLLNQGLDPTSEAYKNAMSDFSTQRNDAYSSALNNAVGQSTAAGDSLFRNDLMAHQQGLAQALQQYGMPMQQLQALQGLTAQPGFMGAGQAQGPNLLGAAGLQGTYGLQAQALQNGNLADVFGGGTQALGGLVPLASMLIPSDERLKTNIVRHELEALPGVPYATWEWREQPGVRASGVIAQDLEAAGFGQYVHEADGVKFVDYSFLSEADDAVV